MALITSVIVNGINNLSDARYCAGMGAEMLGFCLDETQANYVAPAAVRELAGWVAGVQLVGEFNRATVAHINETIAACCLNYVQLNQQHLIDEIQQLQRPVLQRVPFTKDTIESELIAEMNLYQDYVAYFLIYSEDYHTIDDTNIRFLQNLARHFKIFINFGLTKENVAQVIQEIQPAGIGLQGGQEIKPGLKDFDALQEIFEVLDDNS